jgi:hypothetical protein
MPASTMTRSTRHGGVRGVGSYWHLAPREPFWLSLIKRAGTGDTVTLRERKVGAGALLARIDYSTLLDSALSASPLLAPSNPSGLCFALFIPALPSSSLLCPLHPCFARFDSSQLVPALAAQVTPVHTSRPRRTSRSPPPQHPPIDSRCAVSILFGVRQGLFMLLDKS